jgi:hypothetical protein
MEDEIGVIFYPMNNVFGEKRRALWQANKFEVWQSLRELARNILPVIRDHVKDSLPGLLCAFARSVFNIRAVELVYHFLRVA